MELKCCQVGSVRLGGKIGQIKDIFTPSPSKTVIKTGRLYSDEGLFMSGRPRWEREGGGGLCDRMTNEATHSKLTKLSIVTPMTNCLT